jgi:uncharacterized protein (DUF4415 family)
LEPCHGSSVNATKVDRDRGRHSQQTSRTGISPMRLVRQVLEEFRNRGAGTYP